MHSRKDDSSDQEIAWSAALPPPRPGVFLPYRIPFAPTAPPFHYPFAITSSWLFLVNYLS